MPFPHMGTVLFAILAFLIPIVLFVSAVLVHRHVVEQRSRKNSLSRVSGLDPPLGTRDPALLWPAPLSATAGSHCSKSSHSYSSARLEEVVVIGRRPTSAAAAAASEGRADSRSLDGSVMFCGSSSSEGRASSEHCGSPLSNTGSSGRVVGSTQGKSMVLDAHHAAEHGTCGSSHHDSSNGCSNADIATQHCVNSTQQQQQQQQQQQLCGHQQPRTSAGAASMMSQETLRFIDIRAAAQAPSSAGGVAAGPHMLGGSTPHYSFNSNASSSAEATAQAQGQNNNLLQKQQQQHRLSPAGAGAADAADVLHAADQQADPGAAATAAAVVSASQPHVMLGGRAGCYRYSSIFDTNKGQSGTPDLPQASLQLQQRLSTASAGSDVRCDVLHTPDQHALLTPVVSDTAAAAPVTPNNSLAGQYMPSSLQPVLAAKFALQQPPALPLQQSQQQEQQQPHWHQ